MYLGLDLGTSAVKATLIDEEQAVVGSGSAPLTVSRPQPGWSEQNPRDWIAATERALDALRAEFRANGRETLYDAVHDSLVGQPCTAPYRTIAERFGTSESAVKVTVHRMRRRYCELVRAEVAETVECEEAVDDELRYLRTALARTRHA